MMWLSALTSPVGPLLGPGVLGTGVEPPTPPPGELVVGPGTLELPRSAIQPVRHDAKRAMIVKPRNFLCSPEYIYSPGSKREFDHSVWFDFVMRAAGLKLCSSPRVRADIGRRSELDAGPSAQARGAETQYAASLQTVELTFLRDFVASGFCHAY